MPQFRSSLPPRTDHQGFDIVRTPTASTLKAVITSPDMVVVDTHYWHGRTTPCERITNDANRTIDDTLCQACRLKHPWRTHAYVSIWNSQTRTHSIYECTDAAAEPLEAYLKANGTLRGCEITAYRGKATTNGKVTIVTRPIDLAKAILPNAPDVRAALCTIWRLPPLAFTQSTPAVGVTHLDPQQDPLSHVHGTQTADADAGDNPHAIRDIVNQLTRPQPPNGGRKNRIAAP